MGRSGFRYFYKSKFWGEFEPTKLPPKYTHVQFAHTGLTGNSLDTLLAINQLLGSARASNIRQLAILIYFCVIKIKP